VTADLLRDLYVDVALRDVLTDDRARTDSRVSLLTGVHRKEIRRQRETPPQPDQGSEVITLSSQIIARWLGASPWAGEAGVPLPLASRRSTVWWRPSQKICGRARCWTSGSARIWCESTRKTAWF
jgi:hypothetical protein